MPPLRFAKARSRPLEAAVLCVVIAVLVLVVVQRRRHRVKYVPQETPAVLGVAAPTIHDAIEERLKSDSGPSWVTRERWNIARALYGKYENAPLWLEEEGVNERAGALLLALESAPEHALRVDEYPIDSIRKVVQRVDSTATPKDMANADVLLTAAYVAYASDMLVGQVDPRTLSQSWHIPARKSAVDSALAATLADTAIDHGLQLMAPQDSEYAVLKREHQRYRALIAAGGWKNVSEQSNAKALKERLEAEGYTVPDDSVSAYVKVWQERHNLDPDGKLGRATLAAFNVSATDRMRQIASNMERHRWLPRALGDRYIYVNVPSFRLDAFDSGQRVLTMRVVVGAEYNGRATPVFSDSMRHVVFRPYWKPTPNILKTEILPKMKADKGYLARNDMEIAMEGGDRVVRQKPGPHNSLGLVKFLFPNDYNIYLHDTNQKGLFGKAARAASHGCIRLEQPDALAHYVLGWPTDSVRFAMEAGKNNRWVSLEQKVPVYIVYFTAFSRDGQLYFADDVYRRDEPLKARVKVLSDSAIATAAH